MSKRSSPDIRALMERIDGQNPAQADVEAFRRLLADLPGLSHAMYDLAQSATADMVASMTANASSREVIRHQVEEQRSALGYATATALERMLIEAAVLSWLRYQDLERRYTKTLNGSHTLELGEYWEHRVSAAQRRYLRACETLARVRKLAIGPVQINVGQQQVNQVIAKGAKE